LRDGARVAAILNPVLIIIVGVDADTGADGGTVFLLFKNLPFGESVVNRTASWSVKILNPLRAVGSQVW
jgi:hypothetical protein